MVKNLFTLQRSIMLHRSLAALALLETGLRHIKVAITPYFHSRGAFSRGQHHAAQSKGSLFMTSKSFAPL